MKEVSVLRENKTAFIEENCKNIAIPVCATDTQTVSQSVVGAAAAAAKLTELDRHVVLLWRPWRANNNQFSITFTSQRI